VPLSFASKLMTVEFRECAKSPEIPRGIRSTWNVASFEAQCHIPNFTAKLISRMSTRRPASGDRTARRQLQATGQPVSRTQANDAMTSRLSSYETKCVQRRCFQCGQRVDPFAFSYQGNGATPANILMPLERQLNALQLCR